MRISEVNPELVGKKVSFIFTGLKASGTIQSIYENEYVKGIEVNFDKPIQWGDNFYTQNTFTARLCDDFGSLKNCIILQ
jgi:hypothetical protein